ncbi:DNA polymerase III subunit chi [Shewanella frigidimarina]|jgi:DNA polymerase-3 subunit chi|uniref:DNA polymerase III chi subunit, HolC n=1 Tax=Shewanella frigidimarina (strain NCIMB 400) TaxID=318167 RepID=Q086P5_SHEFN|nr:MULTISPECIES: DNA polymerase III subunit chi [Shewanella]ABI70770.1 DNA polymerase III chi subunit, HolC [Shewanella frigidimarina NCIMB 400]MBB1363878.1 DNA polymerase III subunit chi [Shewanella sp. SR44-4]MBB1438670.1 DNA polymerase III subunit chi [Shewanella sp. SG41-4]MBO1895950.1 DNA polymerase III subunit chi [Shewanella sp. BF02_Schw]PKH33454.1 DNA polymerase III subunit chi [Shewanella sp. ALD9]|tara:strand:+ start:7672 stop:8121 length:450 start_codon:yes stop_codon:yes gene_type:complete
MTQALFYLMPDNHNQMSALDALYLAACRLAEQQYRQQKTVYIHCKDKQQAYAIDELLWQFEPNAFVPHNLKGEGPVTGAPVEIGFDTLGPNKSRQVLINLADQMPSFAVNLPHIIDFVANDDELKRIARNRYRQYQNVGITPSTQALAE